MGSEMCIRDRPVPKAVHRSSCRDKHNWPRPLTPQSIMPSLNHCDLPRHVGVNNLPKVVTRQRRGRELNSQPASCKSSALATRLPSHLVHTSTHSVHTDIHAHTFTPLCIHEVYNYCAMSGNYSHVIFYSAASVRQTNIKYTIKKYNLTNKKNHQCILWLRVCNELWCILSH